MGTQSTSVITVPSIGGPVGATKDGRQASWSCGEVAVSSDVPSITATIPSEGAIISGKPVPTLQL